MYNVCTELGRYSICLRTSGSQVGPVHSSACSPTGAVLWAPLCQQLLFYLLVYVGGGVGGGDGAQLGKMRGLRTVEISQVEGKYFNSLRIYSCIHNKYQLNIRVAKVQSENQFISPTY